jgi:hypothetical protein
MHTKSDPGGWCRKPQRLTALHTPVVQGMMCMSMSWVTTVLLAYLFNVHNFDCRRTHSDIQSNMMERFLTSTQYHRVLML